MSIEHQRIPARRFQARCLELLDMVAAIGTTLVITKHGRPLAKVVPCDVSGERTTLRGSVVREGDLVSPIDW